jgi:hypothetical protein
MESVKTKQSYNLLVYDAVKFDRYQRFGDICCLLLRVHERIISTLKLEAVPFS